jgi:hypothetical protein
MLEYRDCGPGLQPLAVGKPVEPGKGQVEPVGEILRRREPGNVEVRKRRERGKLRRREADCGTVALSAQGADQLPERRRCREMRGEPCRRRRISHRGHLDQIVDEGTMRLGTDAPEKSCDALTDRRSRPFARQQRCGESLGKPSAQSHGR